MSDDLPPLWLAFLTDLNSSLSESVTLHCMGGFAVVVGYGVPRATNDLDYRTLSPFYLADEIHRLAGRDSPLHQKHGLYIQRVGWADIPEDYEERLTEILENRFTNIRLMLVDPYDLVLSKLSRNIDRDREDVKYLATALKLNPETLRARYQNELRPIIIGRVASHDQTLELWIEAYFS
jgi:Nucleotidyltransferase of unknown function (DUF6036)